MRGATDAAGIEASFAWLRWTPTAAEQEACAGGLVVPEIPDDDETSAPGRASLRTTSGWATGLNDGSSRAPGTYTYVAELINPAGTTATAPLKVTVRR